MHMPLLMIDRQVASIVGVHDSAIFFAYCLVLHCRLIIFDSPDLQCWPF